MDKRSLLVRVWLARTNKKPFVHATQMIQKEKLPVLYEVRETLEELQLIIRLCKDIKTFHNCKSFETAVKHVIYVSKQNEIWSSLLLADLAVKWNPSLLLEYAEGAGNYNNHQIKI